MAAGVGRAGVVADGFLAGVREAAAALREVFEPTPLQRNDNLSAKYVADVWLKREDLSPVRALGGAEEVLHFPPASGALREFLTVLGSDDVSRFEYLKKSARNFGSVLRGIETPVRENSWDWRRAWPRPASPGSTSPTTLSSPA